MEPSRPGLTSTHVDEFSLDQARMAPTGSDGMNFVGRDREVARPLVKPDENLTASTG
jgi:hypothetical protein